MPATNYPKPSPGGCCWNPVQAAVLGIDPPPTEHVQNLYFAANVPMEGEFSDILSAGSFGTESIPAFNLTDGGIVLAAFLQNNVSQFSGGGVLDGDSSYSFWFLSDTNPSDWTWNGNPIVFTDLGVATVQCHDTGVFAVTDTSVDAPFGFNNTDMGTFTVQGALRYNDAGLQAQMDTKITQFAGVGTTIALTIDNDLNTVRVVVNNTYLPLKDMFSLIGGVTPQNDTFSPC